MSSKLDMRTGRTGGRAARAGVAVLFALLLSTIGAVAAASASTKPHHVKKHVRAAPKRSASTSVAKFNKQAYDSAASADLVAQARRYTNVVLFSDENDLIPALRRANPRLQIFMYQFIMYARADDPGGLENCATLPQAQANNWFLRAPDGSIVHPPTDPASYGLDIGIPSFAQSCSRHALALAKSRGFNGVFLDGVGAKPDYQFGGPVALARYPTTASWQAAMYGFLQTMVKTVHSGHLKVISNIGGSTATAGIWQRWTKLLDGSEEESWTDGGLGVAQQASAWQEKLNNAAWSEAHHKLTILHSWNTTEAGDTFGLASMLLIANGSSSYSTSNANYLGDEHWFPEYATAQRLGRPTGHYVRLRNGIYERKFAHGVVLVNPALYTRGPAKLGARYSGSGLSHVRRVTLGPTSAVILLRG